MTNGGSWQGVPAACLLAAAVPGLICGGNIYAKVKTVRRGAPSARQADHRQRSRSRRAARALRAYRIWCKFLSRALWWLITRGTSSSAGRNGRCGAALAGTASSWSGKGDESTDPAQPPGVHEQDLPSAGLMTRVLPNSSDCSRLASTEIFPLRKTSAVTLPCPSGPAARKGQGTAAMD